MVKQGGLSQELAPLFFNAVPSFVQANCVKIGQEPVAKNPLIV